MTQVTWGSTTDMAHKKEQAIQDMIKPERLSKSETAEWEVTVKLPCFTDLLRMQMRKSQRYSILQDEIKCKGLD